MFERKRPVEFLNLGVTVYTSSLPAVSTAHPAALAVTMRAATDERRPRDAERRQTIADRCGVKSTTGSAP